jgi:Flp pilus assembly protein TadG
MKYIVIQNITRRIPYDQSAQRCEHSYLGDKRLNDVITGVKVFTDRYGLIRVTVNLNNGNNFTVTLNELIRRKHEITNE